MVKSKILDRLRNNIEASFEVIMKENIRDLILQILSLMIGILLALLLNSFTPLFHDLVAFGLVLVIVIAIAVFSWIDGQFVLIRLLLVGASIVSVVSALVTWASTGESGLIQINLNQIDNIFRSILLASFFSLLERITRFIDDRVEAKKRNSTLFRFNKS